MKIKRECLGTNCTKVFWARSKYTRFCYDCRQKLNSTDLPKRRQNIHKTRMLPGPEKGIGEE